MPDHDLIKRGDAKAAIKNLPISWNDIVPILAALDSLPAAEGQIPDECWHIETFGPYKGFYGAATKPDAMYHGRVLLERDVVTFAADALEDLEEAFRGSVDDYLEWKPAAEGAAGERVESHAESIPQDPRILNQVRRILGNRGFTGYEKYRDSPDGKPSKWLSDDVAVDDDYNSP